MILPSAAAAPPTNGFRFAFLPCMHFRFDHNLRDESLDGSRQRVARFKAIWSAGTKFPTWHRTGPRFGFPEGFGVFDCKPDGTFDFAYQAYGWKAG